MHTLSLKALADALFAFLSPFLPHLFVVVFAQGLVPIFLFRNATTTKVLDSLVDVLRLLAP